MKLDLNYSWHTHTHTCLWPLIPSRPCHTKHAREWWDMTAEGQARRSPLLRIPGAGADMRKPDILHVFNLGVGADFACEGIIVIFRLGLWEGTNVPAALNHAYQRFQHWRAIHKKTPFIKHFDLQKFHTTSSLGPNQCSLNFFWGGHAPLDRIVARGILWLCTLSLQCWPRGGGKAHDTALLRFWLEWELSRVADDCTIARQF